MVFRSSIARPTDTPIYASTSTSRCSLQDSGPRWIRFSFLVGLFHSQQHAGLSRRTYDNPVFRPAPAPEPAPEKCSTCRPPRRSGRNIGYFHFGIIGCDLTIFVLTSDRQRPLA